MINFTDTEIIKTDCALCVNCCGINAYVRNGRLTKIEGMQEHPVNRGAICPKAERLVEHVYSPDRLLYPMKKEEGEWKRISWDEAMYGITDKLQEIRDNYGAHALAIIAGSVGVERLECAAFSQRFKGVFGTPNFFSVESGCYVSRIVARNITFGRFIDHDFQNSRCIVLWGHNPHVSRFTLGNHIDRLLEKGLKLIVIDPRRTTAAKKGIHIPIRPGTDCALALAMLNVIIGEGLYDKEFVKEWTVGFDKLREHVRQYSPEKVEEITWVSAADIKQIARLYASARPACIIQGFGSLDRQINNIQNSRVLSILQTVTGNIDIPGGWLTVQGYPIADLRVPVEENPIGVEKYPLFYKRYSISLGVEEAEQKERFAPYGPETIFSDAVLTEKPYPIKGLIVCAGNPAVTYTDSKKFRQAINKLDLVVVMDMFMTETAELADYFLPASSFLEAIGLGALPVGAVHGIPYIMIRRKVIEPVGESWPDWKIWAELGRRLGFEKEFPWKTDEEVIEHFLEPCGVDLGLLMENSRGIFLPKEYEVYKKIGFQTPSGKIEIFSESMEKAGYDPLPTHQEPSQSPISTPEMAEEYPLILITGARILEYIHSGLRSLPEIRHLYPYPIAEIHPSTAAQYEIVNGEIIIVETKTGRVKFKAEVTEGIHQKVISIPHGWAQANVNLLTSDEVCDPIAGYPQDKALLCRIRKI